MLRYLLVGDPHATVEELDDCEGLIDCIVDVFKTEDHIDAVVLLGDLHHNHAIVHVDVMAFWRRALYRLLETVSRVIIIRGNHDAPTSGSTAHALMSYAEIPGVVVVDRPMVLDGIAFVPYTADREAFVAACKDLDVGKPPPRTLICHQTFDGSRYENGFYAGDGIDPALVPQARVISGHIHAPQSFGKVWYPGAPRWRTVSDANTERLVYVQEFDVEGYPAVARRYPTHLWCRAIWKTTVRDGQVVDGPALDDSRVNPMADQWHIDLHGTAEGNKTLAADLAQRTGTHIRCFNTDTHAPKVRESEGIETAFRRWLGGYRPRHNTPLPVLEAMAAARFAWK